MSSTAETTNPEEKQAYCQFLCCSVLVLIIMVLQIYVEFGDNAVVKTINVIFKTDRKRIFSIWMYNNEAEAAYINLWRLYDYVDYFIITVSNSTFTGLPKNISFAPFEKEIGKYKDKMMMAYLPFRYCDKKNYPNTAQQWCAEYSQRDYALKYIRENMNPTTDDILLVGDCDEIYTREAIQYIRKYPPDNYYSVPGSMYFPYYFHFVDKWDPNLVLRYSDSLTTLTRNRWLSFSTAKLIKSKKAFVTHCTYCFRTLEQYLQKIKAFSHQEFNKPPYTTPNWIFKSHYCRTKINSPPGYDENDTNWKELIPNDPRLRFLIDPSYTYDIKLTSYTQKDLETLCDRKYRRTPFPEI